jgi:hypothetical protein
VCLTYLESNFNIFYDDVLLNDVKYEKLLGITIDNCWSWCQQINNIVSKISSRLGLMCRVRTYLRLSIVIACNFSYMTSFNKNIVIKYIKIRLQILHLSRWTHYHWFWFHSIYNHIITSTPWPFLECRPSKLYFKRLWKYDDWSFTFHHFLENDRFYRENTYKCY